MIKIRVLHFTSIINRDDFIDTVVRNADSEKYLMMASSYRGFSNIENTNYETIGIPSFTLHIDHGWMDMFRGAWRLSKILRREKIDILHTHHFYEAIIGRLACFLHPKTVHIIGRHYHDQFYLTASGLKLRFYLFVEHIINSLAKAIIVPSTLIVDLLIKQGVKPGKIEFIPYGFDFNSSRYQKFTNEQVEVLRGELGWTGKFIIGNIGRHHSIKGQIYLIRALKLIQREIPQSLLIMVGDGPYHRELVDEVGRLDLVDSVIFMGWRKDSTKLINGMNVVVHPTLQEAFPQLMIEVMALRKPLVITPVSGVIDVIQDQINGFLIPFKDENSIVHTVKGIYLNEKLSITVSETAERYVKTNFTIQKIIPRFERVYEMVRAK